MATPPNIHQVIGLADRLIPYEQRQAVYQAYAEQLERQLAARVLDYSLLESNPHIEDQEARQKGLEEAEPIIRNLAWQLGVIKDRLKGVTVIIDKAEDAAKHPISRKERRERDRLLAKEIAKRKIEESGGDQPVSTPD